MVCLKRGEAHVVEGIGGPTQNARALLGKILLYIPRLPPTTPAVARGARGGGVAT